MPQLRLRRLHRQADRRARVRSGYCGRYPLLCPRSERRRSDHLHHGDARRRPTPVDKRPANVHRRGSWTKPGGKTQFIGWLIRSRYRPIRCVFVWASALLKHDALSRSSGRSSRRRPPEIRPEEMLNTTRAAPP